MILDMNLKSYVRLIWISRKYHEKVDVEKQCNLHVFLVCFSVF